MGLYLGNSTKLKVTANGSLVRLNVPLSSSLNGIVLKSSDNYILKSSNERILTAKEDK